MRDTTSAGPGTRAAGSRSPPAGGDRAAAGGAAGRRSDPAPETAAPAGGPGTPRPAAGIKPIPRPPWAVGVYGISGICGMLDAACFLRLGHVFAEVMTGNLVLLAFTAGAHGTPELTSALSGSVLPYLVALACFAAGAVAGGRLVQAGEAGRRAGFASDAALIGMAALAAALTHPGPGGRARYLVVGILAVAMGIQNALLRRWGVRDLATNVMTLTLTGLLAESALGGGTNPRAGRRGASIAVFIAGAAAGAAMTRYGVLWPILVSFTVFALVLPILMQPPAREPSRCRPAAQR